MRAEAKIVLGLSIPKFEVKLNCWWAKAKAEFELLSSLILAELELRLSRAETELELSWMRPVDDLEWSLDLVEL